MTHPKTVKISGLELLMARPPVGASGGCEQAVRNWYFNRAMADLYRAGCRRIRAAVPLPRTGDGETYIMRGEIS